MLETQKAQESAIRENRDHLTAGTQGPGAAGAVSSKVGVMTKVTVSHLPPEMTVTRGCKHACVAVWKRTLVLSCAWLLSLAAQHRYWAVTVSMVVPECTADGCAAACNMPWFECCCLPDVDIPRTVP